MVRFKQVRGTIAQLLNTVCYLGVIWGGIAHAEVMEQETAGAPFFFSLPTPGNPTVVKLDFELEGINSISSTDETFEFTGILTLTWKDLRVAFDPNKLGVPEILYQGDYQFNEVAAGWYPQAVLVNDAGALQKSGVQLRIRPDGTSILKEKLTAVAELDLDMHRFPFDSHYLDAAFEILGHESDEVDLQVQEVEKNRFDAISIPEWTLANSSLHLMNKPSRAPTVMRQTAVFRIEAKRQSFFMRRLIIFPMIVIVLLSFSIFWMEKSSLSDRNSVSFVGVLTAVAYQQIVVSVMPPVSYVTYMHGALVVSFILMTATVPVNFIVAALDKRRKIELGDRIDHIGRWLFPLLYFSGLLTVYLFTNVIAKQ